MPSRFCRTLTFITLLGGLAACTGRYDDWTPVVDAANDPHADRLTYDTAQCRQLALRAGQQEITVEDDITVLPLNTSSHFLTDDFDSVSTKAYRHAYISCLKERGHPVLTLMPPPD